MSQQLTLEERVADLEKQVHLLTDEVLQRKKPGWVHKILGSMESDPDFAEILRLGREIRQGDHDG